MKKIIILILSAILSAISSLFSQDLDEILKKHFETIGQDKVLGVENIVAKGKILQMGMEMTFTNTMTRSGKLYLEVPFQGMTMKRGYDGQVAWMVAPWTGSMDPVELGELEVKMIKQQVDIDGMLYEPEKKGYKAEYLGEEDMEGTRVYVIKLTDETGDEFYHYLDAENYVLLKQKSVIAYQGSKLEVETFMGNYIEVEGMIMPSSIESKVNGQVQSQIVMEEYLINQPLDDSIFVKPAPAPKPEENPEK
jgi:hypothetical protein